MHWFGSYSYFKKSSKRYLQSFENKNTISSFVHNILIFLKILLKVMEN